MKSSHQATLTTCWLMLQALSGLPFVHSSTPLMATLEVSSSHHEMIVSLNCENGPEGHSEACFYNRVGDVVRNVTVQNQDAKMRHYVIELNTTTEGHYSCRVGDQLSDEVLLVAYPFSDPSISRSYTASLGDPLRMRCTVPFGILRDRYSVRWFKGVTEILPSDSDRVRFGEDGSLEFTEIEVGDASRGYYCSVNVNRPDGVVVRQGSTIELNVLDPLLMRTTLSDVSVQVNTEASFMCSANGIPAPRFSWLLNGIEHTDGVTSTNETRTTTVHVESTLVLPAVTETDTGAVTCVAYQERNGQVVVVASTANLIVLTNDFTVIVTLQDDEVRIRGTLPVVIPGLFSLRVRFTSSEAVSREENTYLWDPSLVDTREIDVVIPRDKLPSFQHFTVMVAIRRGEVNGPFSEPSNAYKLRDDFTAPVGSPTPNAGGTSTTVVAIIAVLVVLVLVGIAVLVVGCALIYHKKGSEVYKTSRASSEYSAPQGSLPRSVSRSSYGSDRSRSSRHSSRSSRSRTYSSQSDVSSNKAEFVLKKVQEEPQDIREYETMDHKMLSQWEQRKAHLDQHQQRGSLEDVQQVRRGREPEPIFPHTHIGVPNALALPMRQHFKESHSSFEDLEEECLELSMEVPKSC